VSPIAKLHEDCLVVNIYMRNQESCPRCDKRGLKSWDELNDEEREVVKRLPLKENYPLTERQANHGWCTRCWWEDRGSGIKNA